MMKVVALKIFNKQNQLIRALVNKGLYSSISEPLRQAGWDLLHAILAPLEEGDSNIRTAHLPDEFTQQFKTEKTVSVSSKFPLKMIELIDWVVAETNAYQNRSDFFRIALTGLLVTDSQLFSPYILDKGSLVKSRPLRLQRF
ncbi:MAG: hypothetical protein ACXAC7_21275 [Candidatus Hodarchaeales archaeon]|jgi:Arc/MetJ-type ribon-helix-helix transcriptional regulator